MSFADPQTISPISGISSLPRTGFGPSSGSFSSADTTVKLDVSHAYGKRTRRQVRLTQNKVSADPLTPTNSLRTSMTAYIVVDTPVNGFTVAEAKIVVDALVAYLTTSTGARVTQLLGGES